MPEERPDKSSSHLLRKGRYGEAGVIYIVTKCREQTRSLDLSLPLVAKLIVKALLIARTMERCYLLAWCLMPEHIHMLVSPRAVEEAEGPTVGARSSGRPPLPPLSRFVADWANSAAHLVNRSLRQNGSLWQEGFHDHATRRDERLQDVVSYIHYNPVRRGLVETAEQWPWSSANPEFANATDWDWLVM